MGGERWWKRAEWEGGGRKMGMHEKIPPKRNRFGIWGRIHFLESSFQE